MDAKFFRKNADEDDFAIRIDYNGQWYHEGTPIARDRLAKLFSTVLHYDAKTDEYWLVTPVEQGRIKVEDVPYVITDFELSNDTLTLTTNLGHTVTADANHQIECNPDNGLAYIHVNNGVKARLNRMVREKLINVALDQGEFDKNTGKLQLKINEVEHVIAINTGDVDAG